MNKELKIRIRVDSKTGQLEVLDNDFKSLERRIHKTSASTKLLRASLLGITAATAGVVASLSPAIGKFREYETLTANIAKTTGLGFGSDELNELTNELDKMSTTMRGIKTQDLYEIAEGAGQLGIKGRDDILSFTKSIKMLQMTTDLSAQEASTGFARIANALDEPITNIDHLASAYNELSNNSTATVRDLMMFTQRMAPVARGFGLTSAEVVGLSGALKDMGINFEVGGTAMNKLMGEMQANTALFAQQIGIPFEEFERIMREKPMKALELFSQKLASLNAGDKYKFLDNLGFSGTEAQTVLLNVSNNLQKVKTNIDIANQGYISGVSHINEYNQASQTIDARITQMNSSFDILQKTIGSVFRETLADSSENIIAFLNETAQYVIEHKDVWIENFQIIWEYISDGLTTVGGLMADFFNFIAENIDTVTMLGEAFVFLKVGSALLSGISTAITLMDSLGNATAMAGNKASIAGGKFSRLLSLMSSVQGAAALGIGAVALGAAAVNHNMSRADEARNSLTGIKDLKATESAIKRTINLYNRASDGADRANGGVLYSSKYYAKQLNRLGYMQEKYASSAKSATKSTRSFSQATKDAVSEVTNLAKVTTTATTSKPISFAPTGELFTKPPKPKSSKKIQSDFAKEMRAKQREQTKRVKLAQKETDEKARFLSEFNNYRDKSLLNHTEYEKKQLSTRLANYQKHGMDKVQIEKIRTAELEKIENKSSKKQKSVWGAESKKMFSDAKNGAGSSCKDGNCGKSGSFISKGTSQKYADQAGKTFSKSFKDGLVGKDSQKSYESIGSKIGTSFSAVISGTLKDYVNAEGDMTMREASRKNFDQQGSQLLKQLIGSDSAFVLDLFNALNTETRNDFQMMDVNIGSDNTGIADSISLLENRIYKFLRPAQNMEKYLKSMEQTFGSVAVALSSVSGFDYTGRDFNQTSGGMNDIFKDGKLISYNAGGVKGGIGGFVGGFMDSLFGTTTKTLEASGIAFGEQSAQTFLDGVVDGVSYQDVKVTKRKLFGLVKSTGFKTVKKDLDQAVEQNLSDAMNSGYDAIKEAMDILGAEANPLGDLKFDAIKLDFKDKSDEEIEKIITGAFTERLDTLASQVFTNIEDYKVTGENETQTVIRVASEFADAQYALSRLGLEAVKFDTVANKSAKSFGGEIAKTTIALKEGDSGLGRYIDGLSNTTKEVIDAYKATKNLQIGLKAIHGSFAEFTADMVEGAGGLEPLLSARSSYIENFLTSEEQSAILWAQMNEEMKIAGVAVPKTKDAFRELTDSLLGVDDKAYAKMLTLSAPFAELMEKEKEFSDERIRQIEEARDLIFSNQGINNTYKLSYAESLYKEALKNQDRENIKKYSQKTTDYMYQSQYGLEAQNRMLKIVNDTQRALGSDTIVQEVKDKELAKKVEFLISETKINTAELAKMRTDIRLNQKTGS